MFAPAIALAQQANVNLDWNPQKNTENLIPFSAPLNSPEVRDDRIVTFWLRAPNAKEVTLTGAAILTAAHFSGRAASSTNPNAARTVVDPFAHEKLRPE